MGDGGEMSPSSLEATPMERPMARQLEDLSRSPHSLEQDRTIIAVIEMSQAHWLVAGIVPGIERHPLKKLEPSEVDLLRLLMRWRAEAIKKGRPITRIAVAFEAGRDGFWLARWLRARDIESYVIHPTSVAVSREHRRAKTDRLDTCSNASSLAGCAANPTTATWRRSRRSRKRMPSARTGSARGSSVSARALSTV